MTVQQAGASMRPRVEEVAASYRAVGYHITLDPSPDQLPEFLAGYRPDFLAERAGEYVLVEVKDAATSSDEEHYRELAERVQMHPQWRVDLVVLGTPDRLSLGAELPVLPASDVERQYEEADDLAANGHDAAAVLIAWAATEAALRLLAERNAVPVQRASTPVLLKQLTTLGVIAREQYNTLWTLYQQRNAIAHGFAAKGAPRSAERITGVGRELLAEAREAA